MRKRALLVGINKYRNPNFPLFGCVNDVNRARDFLESEYGFNRADIDVVTDADANRKSITDGFTSLVRYALEGDRIAFWFSGHGTRKYTPDVAEPDQLAECVVPWETASESLIEDKWFGKQLNTVVSRGYAANMTLVFDCCHSGTITRMLQLDVPDVVRNRHIPFSQLVDVAPDNDVVINRKARGMRSRGTFRGMRSIALGSWDVLSACQDEQEAADTFIDGEHRGLFSYCLLKALREAPATSYDTLERRLRSDFKEVLPAHNQEPAFEVRNSQSTFMEIPANPGTGIRSIPISTRSRVIDDVILRGVRREFAAYAGPMVFGPWVTIGSHIGSAGYSISGEPIGATLLSGEVRYFGTDGTQKIATFGQSISIQTGNSIANVEVRFKGVPLGSAIRGFVSP